MKSRNHFNRSYWMRWYVHVINAGIVMMIIGFFVTPLFPLGALLLFIGASSHYHDSRKRLKKLRKD